MIEFIAEGPITRVTDDKRIRREDGHDEIRGRVTTMVNEEIRMDIEFPQGHVNLEGHAPSSVGGWTVWELVTRHLEPDGAIEITRSQRDEWDVELRGEWFDWVQQAHRYVVERPNKSVLGCLETFNGWGEVNGKTVQDAMRRIEERVEFATTRVGELDAAEWELLQEELNDLENVNIPESYSG